VSFDQQQKRVKHFNTLNKSVPHLGHRKPILGVAIPRGKVAASSVVCFVPLAVKHSLLPHLSNIVCKNRNVSQSKSLWKNFFACQKTTNRKHVEVFKKVLKGDPKHAVVFVSLIQFLNQLRSPFGGSITPCTRPLLFTDFLKMNKQKLKSPNCQNYPSEKKTTNRFCFLVCTLSCPKD
jgi:hypothetical protein